VGIDETIDEKENSPVKKIKKIKYMERY